MFSHVGPARSERKNAILAGYLALVAGFVNSGGFVLVGTFTSHVTGSVGRFSMDVASGSGSAAFFAFLLVTMFFAGAFVSSLILESSFFSRSAAAYGVALLTEAGLLAAFIFLAGLSHATHPRALDAEAAILCFAMGTQNCLVTRLSGAVVRTTHLTGVITDLGIEAARWYRWHRATLLPEIPMLFPSRSPPLRPAPAKAILLGTIVIAFGLGALIGGVATLRASRWAMIAPAVAIMLASLYAFIERDDPEDVRPSETSELTGSARVGARQPRRAA